MVLAFLSLTGGSLYGANTSTNVTDIASLHYMVLVNLVIQSTNIQLLLHAVTGSVTFSDVNFNFRLSL
jgi:hypothetical protein